MTIWKFPFDVNDGVAILMPTGARVLDVQIQDGRPCIWAIVDPDAATEVRQFIVRGTGIPLRTPTSSPTLGTFQMMGGALVFHMFEESR